MSTEKELKRLLQMSDDLLEKIIDEELEKPENEMNADLIGLCSETLHRRHIAAQNTPRKSSKRSSVKRIIAIAAALSVILASVGIVFAGINDNSVKRSFIVSVDGIFTNIDTKNNKTVPSGYALADTELAKKIADNGINNNIIIPEVLTNGEYSISDIIVSNSDGWGQLPSTTVQVNFETKGCYGYIAIHQGSAPYNSKSQIVNLKDIELFSVNGMDIILISFKKDPKNFLIKYYDSVQELNYNITIRGSHEDAVQIIESIK